MPKPVGGTQVRPAQHWKVADPTRHTPPAGTHVSQVPGAVKSGSTAQTLPPQQGRMTPANAHVLPIPCTQHCPDSHPSPKQSPDVEQAVGTHRSPPRPGPSTQMSVGWQHGYSSAQPIPHVCPQVQSG